MLETNKIYWFALVAEAQGGVSMETDAIKIKYYAACQFATFTEGEDYPIIYANEGELLPTFNLNELVLSDEEYNCPL